MNPPRIASHALLGLIALASAHSALGAIAPPSVERVVDLCASGAGPAIVAPDHAGGFYALATATNTLSHFDHSGAVTGTVGLAMLSNFYGPALSFTVAATGEFLVLQGEYAEVLRTDGTLALTSGRFCVEASPCWEFLGMRTDCHGTPYAAHINGDRGTLAYGLTNTLTYSREVYSDQLWGTPAAQLPGGRIVVLHPEGDFFYILGLDGSVAHQVGGPGSAPSELSGPSDLTVDAAGNIVVADTGNDRVQVYGRDGEPLLSIHAVEGYSSLDHPSQVFATDSGELLVLDKAGCRVTVFATNVTANHKSSWGALKFHHQ